MTRALVHGPFAGLVVAAAATLILIFISLGAFASPSPASMGLDKTTATGSLSVQDKSGTWVNIGAVNSTAHTLAIPNASLANTSVTVGGAACSLGGTCSPSTTVGGTACGLGSSCAPAVTVNGTTCTLGASCSPSSAVSLIVGTSPTSGGAAGQLMFDTGSVLTESAALVFTSPTLKIVSNTGALAIGATPDTFLLRDAANSFAQRNGTTSQLFSVYNTFTSATTYERGVLDWKTTANTLTIGSEVGGSGGSTTGNVQFVSDSVPFMDWNITTPTTLTINGQALVSHLTAGSSSFTGLISGTNISLTGSMSAASTSAGALTASTIAATSTISTSSGNITASAGSLVASGATATVTTGQIAYGGTVVASSACGTLSGAAGCVKINVAGTDHFVPYY